MLREEQGDVTRVLRRRDFPLLVTTNGVVNARGECVMGRGIALQVKQMDRRFASDLGTLINQHGNRPMRVRPDIWSFPVKHHWAEKADLELIEKSFAQLAPMALKFEITGLHLPRPGCGNGGLDWKEVRPLVVEFERGLPHLDVVVWDYK